MSDAKAHQSIAYHVTAGDLSVGSTTAPPTWTSGTFILTCVVADNGAAASVVIGATTYLVVRVAAGYSEDCTIYPGLRFAPTAAAPLVLSRGAAGTATFIGYWD